MKNFIIAIGTFIVIALLLWLGSFYWNNLRGIWPILLDADKDISDLIENKDSFDLSIFAKNLPGARVIIQDSLGNLWVSQPKEGQVSLLTIEDNKVINQNAIFKNLNKPHGLALDPQDPFNLYIAEEDKISKVRIYSEDNLEKLVDLSSGGRHTSRTIAFGPDEKLYISIGSSCDVCLEEDKQRAAIYRMDKDGSNFETYATGLRNTVFFTWDPIFGDMYGTDMGRDMLGDDLPPDEINLIKEDLDYGWPYCYGRNIHDDQFDPEQNVSCQKQEPSLIDLPAHSAPLGLSFIPKEGWPEDYWSDLIVAYHGSWNRTEPTGYKLVRHKFEVKEDKLVYQGVEDLITGWLQGRTSSGRPVDVLVQPNGIIYLTDDKAGVVYRITYQGN